MALENCFRKQHRHELRLLYSSTWTARRLVQGVVFAAGADWHSSVSQGVAKGQFPACNYRLGVRVVRGEFYRVRIHLEPDYERQSDVPFGCEGRH